MIYKDIKLISSDKQSMLETKGNFCGSLEVMTDDDVPVL